MNTDQAIVVGLQFFSGMIGIVGGMVLLRSGLQKTATSKLEPLLQKAVKTPLRGLLTGGIFTSLLHSSAAVTLLTMGLVGAGTIRFADSIGVILGSNIGTCVTTQILSFDMDTLILPMLLIGILLFLLRKIHWAIESISWVLVGFGVLFLSLHLISVALEPLAREPWFLHLLTQSGSNRMFGFLAGMSLTALLTSSTATTALTLTLASQHLLTLPQAVAIVIGNNVGTCITAVLASIGGSLIVKRVALAHVLLNVIGAAIFLPLIDPFSAFIKTIAAEPGVQTATAHTLFNVISSLAMLPFTSQFAKLLMKILPE